MIAGVDEAGRGPLAGPVYAAAVILDGNHLIEGLADSKRLSRKRREGLFEQIQTDSLAWSIATASVEEIDQYNILQATYIAMRRAVEGLQRVPDLVKVDGNRVPPWDYKAEAVVGGDACVAEISAASILAKVARDRHMEAMARQYPDYGFAEHKGYPTQKHLAALRCHGACKIHRQSYLPVQQAGLFPEAES